MLRSRRRGRNVNRRMKLEDVITFKGNYFYYKESYVPVVDSRTIVCLSDGRDLGMPQRKQISFTQ